MFGLLQHKMKLSISYLLYILIIGRTTYCDNKQKPKVFGGQDAFPGQFPWMISLQAFSKAYDAWEHHCGGAIIDHRHIVSAAHCYIPRTSEPYRVLAGAHDVLKNDSGEPTRQAYKPCRFHVHPAWNEQYFTNDMMVITLDKSILFNERVQPIRLAPADSDPVGQVCVALGWGPRKSEGTEQNLKTVNLTVISLEECSPWDDHHPFELNEYNICAEPDEYGKGTEGGDSGSPLVCYDEKGPYTVGALSWGPEPIGTGDVYGGVKEHLDFIKCIKKKG